MFGFHRFCGRFKHTKLEYGSWDCDEVTGGVNPIQGYEIWLVKPRISLEKEVPELAYESLDLVENLSKSYP